MKIARHIRMLPIYRLAALATLLAAAFAAAACGSDSQTGGAPDTSEGSTRSPAVRSTATLTPPKTLMLVERYDPAGFPAFTLPRAGGGELNSADYIGKQPVAVVFYRGNFWGICHGQLVELQQRYREFQALDVEIIAISVDSRPQAESIVTTRDLKYPVLYDTNTAVSRSWNVYDLLGDGVSAPSMFVFGPSGHLVAAYIGSHAGDRPDADDILKVARDFMSGPPPQLATSQPIRPTPTPEPTVAAAPVETAEPSPGTTPTPDPGPTPLTPPDRSTTALAPPKTLKLVEKYDPAGFPVFTLPRAGGGELNSADYIGKQPVSIVFYRGNFWGTCHGQLVELQQRYQDFQALNVEIIAISVDDRDQAEAMVEARNLTFPVLYDTDTAVSRSWNVFDLLGDDVSAPATFVFGPSGHLVAAYVGTNAGDRPDADDILKVARDFMSGPPPELAPSKLVRPTPTPGPTAEPASGSTPTPDPEPTADAAATAPLPIEFREEVENEALGFSLPDAHGGEVSLADYRGDKNVIVVFYRAFWWGFCRQQLVELRDNYDSIAALETEVLAISTDNLDGTEALIQQYGLPFPLLYTSGDAAVPEGYNVFDLFGDGLASASVFLIDKSGAVVWQDIGTNFSHQVSAETIVEQLEQL